MQTESSAQTESPAPKPGKPDDPPAEGGEDEGAQKLP
jgi:hypothetical protein